MYIKYLSQLKIYTVFLQPRYSEKYYTSKFKELFSSCWCLSEVHKHNDREVTEISAIELCHYYYFGNMTVSRDNQQFQSLLAIITDLRNYK